MRATVYLAAVLGLCWGSMAHGADYSGEWSYQALNAGDTNFKVEQTGAEIKFYRVLHPEFEGERYKLEHMYRGRLAGQGISGKLFVREEGMQDFEFLRPFNGKVERDNRMILDDMPLKRLGGVSKAPAKDPPPKYTRVIIKRDKQEEKTGPSGKPVADKPASNAPLEIPELIPVANRIKTPKGRKVEAMLTKGDGFYSEKRYQEAVEYYEAALKLDPHKVELLYKLGLAHGVLGSLAVRRGGDASAGRHLQHAIRFWTQAVRFDPYNYGARENIKRAKRKLKKLK